MICAGFSPEEPYLQQKLREHRAWELTELKGKCKLWCPDSAVLFGADRNGHDLTCYFLAQVCQTQPGRWSLTNYTADSLRGTRMSCVAKAAVFSEILRSILATCNALT